MKTLLIILISSISALNVFGADVVYHVKHTGNLVFFGSSNPVIDMSIYNNKRSDAVKRNIKCTVKSDKGELVYLLEQQVGILPGDSTNLAFSFYSPNPGFYTVLLEDDIKMIKEFNICYEPEKIFASYPDILDAEAFWKWMKKRTAYNFPEYKVVKLKDKRAKYRDAYSVSMKFPNGELLQGHYLVPVSGKESAAVRVKILYGDKIDLEKETRYNGKCIDFILPIDSMATRDSLFYTGTILKYIAAIDFLVSRKEVGDRGVFAVGEGLTGGIVLGAAAADARIKGVAVYNPFMDEAALRGGSNLLLGRIAPQVKCPVLFGMGLQDSIALPRRLFDVYNRIKLQKEYYIFPFSDMSEDKDWDVLKNNFLLKYSQ